MGSNKNESISFEAIATCLLRSAQSRPWMKGANQGNVAYLCDKDLAALDNEIRERAYISKALDTVTVTDKAAKLKIARIQKGIEFLRILKCDKLAMALDNIDVKPPSCAWVNDLINDIVIVLPSHTTHVLQLFNVGLTGALKQKFTNIFHAIIRK